MLIKCHRRCRHNESPGYPKGKAASKAANLLTAQSTETSTAEVGTDAPAMENNGSPISLATVAKPYVKDLFRGLSQGKLELYPLNALI